MSDLTIAQYSRLDRLAKDEPDAKVVRHTEGGPIIQNEKGKYRLVREDGRLTPINYISKVGL